MPILTPEQEAALLNFSPMAVKGEPIGVFDFSPSMTLPNGGNSDISRFGLLSEAMPILVARLARMDRAGEHEEGGGGLMSYAFADSVRKLGDVNEANQAEIWSKLRPFGSGTLVRPALDEALNDYSEEFSDMDPTERPTAVIVLGTDGEAHDGPAVLDFFRNRVKGGVRIAVGVFGEGPDHDNTVRSYLDIADSDGTHKKNMRVVSFGGMTSGQQLADAAASLFGA